MVYFLVGLIGRIVLAYGFSRLLLGSLSARGQRPDNLIVAHVVSYGANVAIWALLLREVGQIAAPPEFVLCLGPQIFWFTIDAVLESGRRRRRRSSKQRRGRDGP